MHNDMSYYHGFVRGSSLTIVVLEYSVNMMCHHKSYMVSLVDVTIIYKYII